MSELEKNLETTEVSEGADTAAEPEVSPEVDNVNSAELEAPEEGEEAFDNTDAEDSFDYSQDSVENDAPLEEMDYLEPQDSGEFSEVSDNGTEESEDDLESRDDRELEEPVEYESSTPENTEDIPEDTDETTELTDEIPEGTDENPEPVEENPEGADETPEPVKENPEGADETPELIETVPVNEDDASSENVQEQPESEVPAESTHESANESGDVDQKMTPEEVDALKDRIRESQQQRAEHPSGFSDFDQGKTNILTAEPAKLSSKNFDRLAEERGLTPEEAAIQKYSMNEYQRPDPTLDGAEHHPNKSPEQYATARHILEPEQAYNYNNGVLKDGYENASSGVYQTPEIQTAPDMPEQAAAQENLALPVSNDARVRSDVTLNPTLDDGKQHNVIEGTAAPQNAEKADEAFKGNDNIDRHGGGKQIITDGGYGTGAVTEGAQHNIGDMNTDLNNPNLFKNHPAGEYGYTDAPDGKSGFGQLDNSQKGTRDAAAQRAAGGMDRRPDDDGGHYIANMFNGDSGNRNLDAQNRNLNRGDWKAMENRQNEMLNNGDKVFTNNRSTKLDGSDRPDSYDAYTIVEHPDGSREAIPYHFENESKKH